MSAADNGSPVPYKVEISGVIKTEIKRLANLAATAGQKQAYLDAWLAIEKRLQSDPLQFGECCYHLAKGKLRCQIGVVSPVAVEFAIHEEKHTVVLLKIFLLGFNEGESHAAHQPLPP